DGITIYDNFYVRSCVTKHCYGLPLAITTRERFGREIFMNIVLLGSLAEITKITTVDSLKQAIRHHAPPATLENNLQALNLGVEIAQNQC
ncbi:MAG: 2-oxoacid:acceptor oxidoreductase family protein, partial [candidate division WOR-3 bacterium]|nr:2-oxoacid:acceptor oxidoreductase family protein [candidate division WOR-3 bacterium]